MTSSAAPPRETVLVTGATGGIGEAFARIFASEHCDLVLSARRGEPLGALATQLSEAHQIRAWAAPVDLSQPGGSEQLLAFLRAQSLSVDVLVNNAGFGVFGPFAEAEPGEQLGQIQVNIVALTQLTRALVPEMVKRGRGQILNVASTAAFQPGPLMAIYYATKAYVLSFSEALHVELEGSGVQVTCLCPGPTRTGFMARAKIGDAAVLAKSRLMMTAEDVARAGVLGLRKGRRLVIPGILNRLVAHSTRLGSRGLSARIARRLMKAAHSTREAR